MPAAIPSDIDWQCVSDVDRRVVTGVIRPEDTAKDSTSLEPRDRSRAHLRELQDGASPVDDRASLIESAVLDAEKTVSDVPHPAGTWVMRFQINDDGLWERFATALDPSPQEARKHIENMSTWERVSMPASGRLQSQSQTDTAEGSVWERLAPPSASDRTADGPVENDSTDRKAMGAFESIAKQAEHDMERRRNGRR